MYPNVGSDLPLLGQLDHVHRWRVSTRSAGTAAKRSFKLPYRRVARATDGIKRNAGADLTTIALDFHPAVTGIKALPDRRRRLRPARRNPPYGSTMLRPRRDSLRGRLYAPSVRILAPRMRLPKITSRDLMPMAGITATLASAGNATRIRWPGTATHPTGSDKCATSIQLPRTGPRSSHSSG
jgi:hypothetical protein